LSTALKSRALRAAPALVGEAARLLGGIAGRALATSAEGGAAWARTKSAGTARRTVYGNSVPCCLLLLAAGRAAALVVPLAARLIPLERAVCCRLLTWMYALCVSLRDL